MACFQKMRWQKCLKKEGYKTLNNLPAVFRYGQPEAEGLALPVLPNKLMNRYPKNDLIKQFFCIISSNLMQINVK